MNFHQFKSNFEKEKVTEYKNCVPDKVLVSVCLQAYNQIDYIKKSLDSIIAQKTNFTFEVLLGDDESSDGTREICIDYAKKHPDKIKLFFHHRKNNIKINSKSTGIFNFLYNLFSASGDFIAYCDGDDFWEDEFKLQKQVNYLKEHPNTVLTYHDIQLINHKGYEIERGEYFVGTEKDFSSNELVRALTQPPTCSWCFRNIIKEIPLEFTKTFNADNFFISLLGNYGNGRYLKNIKPSYYRIHNTSVWSTIDKSYQLKSKYYTYLNLSKYYRRKEDINLASYFRVRAKSYAKMYLSRELRDFNIKNVLLFSIKFTRTF